MGKEASCAWGVPLKRVRLGTGGIVGRGEGARVEVSACSFVHLQSFVRHPHRRYFLSFGDHIPRFQGPHLRDGSRTLWCTAACPSPGPYLISIFDTSLPTLGHSNTRLKPCRFSHSVCSSSLPDAIYS